MPHRGGGPRGASAEASPRRPALRPSRTASRTPAAAARASRPTWLRPVRRRRTARDRPATSQRRLSISQLTSVAKSALAGDVDVRARPAGQRLHQSDAPGWTLRPRCATPAAPGCSSPSHSIRPAGVTRNATYRQARAATTASRRSPPEACDRCVGAAAPSRSARTKGRGWPAASGPLHHGTLNQRLQALQHAGL